MKANELATSYILTIHNDSVIFNTRKKIISEIDGIKFHHDNTWDAYIRYDRAEIFYKVDELGNGSLDFKNVGKEKVQEHTFGLNKYMTKVIGYIENYDKDVLKYMRKFQQQYLQDKLPEYYYSSFAKIGDFKTTNFELFALMANIVIREVNSWK